MTSYEMESEWHHTFTEGGFSSVPSDKRFLGDVVIYCTRNYSSKEEDNTSVAGYLLWDRWWVFRNKTISKIREIFYWLGTGGDVKYWCRWCEDCFASKDLNTRGLEETQGLIRKQCNSGDRMNASIQIVIRTVHKVRPTSGNNSKPMIMCNCISYNKIMAGLQGWTNIGKGYTMCKKINDVVCGIQMSLRTKMNVRHFVRLSHYGLAEKGQCYVVVVFVKIQFHLFRDFVPTSKF